MNLKNLGASNYGNDTIKKTEKERDQVRERPNVFFGTDDVYGALNAPMELVVNGSDELGAGYGDTIIMTVDNDWNITVEDNGRGVPMDWNEDQKKYNWDLVYNQMYASGKRQPGAYDAAAGLNGVGASITQFTAYYMRVISRRVERLNNGAANKVEYEMNFENGYPKGELIKRPWAADAKSTGTIVTFKTDESIFQDTHFTIEMVAEKFRRLATVKGGQHYKLRYRDRQEIEFFFKEGPKTVLEAICKERITADAIRFTDSVPVREIIRGRVEEFNVGVDITFTFSVEGEFKESYHNGLYLVEHGTSVDGFRDAVGDVIEAYGRSSGKLGPKDRVQLVDVDELVCFIVSTTFQGEFSSWDGQDKKAIKNGFLERVCKQVVKDKFTEWASVHKAEMDKIVSAVIEMKAARLKAAAVKSNVLKKLSAGVSNYRTRPAKLVDCESKDVKENEIYIVEGESAKGSAVLARNPKLQAIYPLTGKILNCDKATLEAIFHNKVILDLIQTFGCGVEVKSKYLKDLPPFDISKLNYGKIVLSTDADDDGFHIQCLLMVFIYRVMPSLIKAGKVYIAEAPLFMISYNGGKVYTYSIEERDKVLAELKAKNARGIDVYRFKGLGEMASKQMAETTMNPDTRRLTPVDWPEDVEAFEKVMHELMGNDLAERKAWIADYFSATRGELNEADIEISDEVEEDDEFVAAVVDE